jgi:hypothetical protein
MIAAFHLYVPPTLLPRVRLSVDAISSDDDARHLFRFKRQDLVRLLPLLRLPALITTPSRYAATAEEALLIVLYRLAYPRRWRDIEAWLLFKRQPAALCEIFLKTLGHLHTTWQAKLNTWTEVFASANARVLGEATAHKMGYDGALFMLFIDGSNIYVERPGGAHVLQRALYNGHHRQHSVNMLSAITPNGMWAMVRGPFAGTVNDAAAYNISNMEHDLRHLLAPANAGRPLGDRVCAAADSIFPLSDVLQLRFSGPGLTVAEQAYNAAFSSVRIAVEWGLDKVFTLFAGIDWSRKLSVGRSPIAIYILAAFLFTNIHTCFYGSQVAEYFHIAPSLIEEYLQ